MGNKVIIIFINLTGQNRGLSGLKNIWPVIMTGDLLSVILSLVGANYAIILNQSKFSAFKFFNVSYCFAIKAIKVIKHKISKRLQ